MKRVKLTVSAALVACLVIAGQAYAGPLEHFESALVFLQKARITTAVQARSDDLRKAKEQLLLANYDRGGNTVAALGFTMQAIASVSEFRTDQANRQIDMAIVKVKHTVLALKQEAAVKSKSGSAR